MTTETYAERLTKVRTAIDKILSGSQSWRFGDRSYTRADLPTLYKMEERFERLAAKERTATVSGGRNRIRYIGF
ncbi:hypothetical protein [Vreelandella venusta]|uniref:Uncharacterized protein n=1 Tax=Vreelandella venusta TaxID=44935 RepID=A0AAQ0CJ79_9GAMM|nr:hypothetical protein [Halomonas venusta]QRL05141.1 hypothetical protein JDS37_09510 [Halomonas venusta]UQI42512.1 hypothetical protein M3L73_09710 [Halomonas venusta]GEK50909.1 hypothetical protein HVE01_16300 [Halomonas venusta]